jgi:hypothetical protein
MSKPADPSRFLSKFIAVNDSIDAHDLVTFGHFVATEDNLILTHPQPVRGLDGAEAIYTNASSGLTSIVCNDGFSESSGVIVLLPGESTHLWCQELAAETYAWIRQGKDYIPKPVALSSGDYTATWGTADPSPITALIMVHKYKGVCWVQGELSGTDGNDSTSLTVALKNCIPQDVDVLAAFSAEQVVDGAKTANFEGYVDCADGTAANRGIIAFRNFATMTNAKAWSIKFSGSFPLYGATAYTSTPAWTGGPPTVTSTTAVYKDVDGEIYWWLHNILSDGKATSAATFTPPVVPADLGLYTMGRGYVLVNATYTSVQPFQDLDNATAGSRLIGFKNLPELTNGQACAIVAAGHYPIADHISVTPVETFAVAMPALWTTNHKMYASKTGRILNVHYYSTSADGNACTDIDIPLPAVPINAEMDCLMAGYQLVNATGSNPRPYVDYSQTEGEDRATIQQGALSTFTNAVTGTLICSGELLLDA